MARSIQQIKQELVVLEEAVAHLALELRKLYRQYLELLSQSVRQQLILASYQICTQVYPENFLKLSFSEKQTLQASLRKLATQLQADLIAELERANSSKRLPEGISPEQSAENIASETDLLEQPTEDSFKNPEDLVKWSKKVEQGIAEQTDRLSRKVNHVLQQAKVLPSDFPAKILEMAIQAQETGTSTSSAPNLLNLLLETNSDEQLQPSKESARVTKITAIHLRLPEIEFADGMLSRQRQQIRNLLEKLSQLRQQYRQKQQECAVAEAEAAWRATWYDESPTS
jgi:hypothetical protein